MAAIRVEIRAGAYYDSVILMQLQSSLASLPGILDTGVIMGTEANKEILSQSNLLVPEAKAAAADDLVIVVRANDEGAAQAALDTVDSLLTRRRATADQDYLPKSLETAAAMLPEAQWVLVSVPGRYAAAVAHEALLLGKNVFLFSDNVAVEDEIALKRAATKKGLLVMGPDCGTALVNGVGLGFANQVRRGPIGMVAASGTGLQQVSSRIHQLGSGMTHALGTGGRDLSEAVGALTAHQALDFFSRDPDTEVIILLSKPPAPKVAEQLLRAARAAGKPVVVDFIGYVPADHRVGNLHFVETFDEAATLAVALASKTDSFLVEAEISSESFSSRQRYLRGLYSGGTLAYEALLILQNYIPAVYSNAPLRKGHNVLQDSLVSMENSIVDLGEDEFTFGRLHPMMDNTFRIQRLRQEASDPDVAVILLDVVLGYGAHPDPAADLAPAIAAAIATAQNADRHLEVVTIVVGTDEDPQGLNQQIEQLKAAGARVYTRNDLAVRYAGKLIETLSQPGQEVAESFTDQKIDLEMMKRPLAGINAGLESFAASLKEQGAAAIHIDWRPPASGNEKLAGILQRIRSKQSLND